MSPEIIPNITEDYYPETGLDPITILPRNASISLSNEQQWNNESRNSRDQSDEQVLQLCEFLVKIEGNNNAETKGEPEGGVEKEEEFAPSFAGVWSQPQAGRSRSGHFGIGILVQWMREKCEVE